MKKIINVTKTDIIKGEVCSASHCPVAIALNRQFDNSCYVDQLYIKIGELEIETPNIASEFISKFDFGDKVKPFKFALEIK